jgi:CheY-like chemotaxis protein
MKILFVDNSRTTRVVMARFLEKAGYIVETASTGMEAIACIQAQDFDVAIIDFYMPIMNGYEATKLIRALPDLRKSQLPIIALTASQDKKDLELSQSVGMNEFVVKSSDHKDLLTALTKYAS